MLRNFWKYAIFLGAVALILMLLAGYLFGKVSAGG